MYYYWAYGLSIESGIEFPELHPLESIEVADVRLKYGIVPEKIQVEKGYASDTISITSNEYLLRVNQVAAYHVNYGNNIVIEAVEGAPEESIRLFCLSNAFAALLHQRGLIPLHCSAFVDRGELILVMGDSGAGKSTTLAAMMQLGYSVFSDDVCVPVMEKGQKRIEMVSSYPMMKYWGDTFNKIELGKTDRKIRPEIDKYGIYFHEKFITDALPVKMVVVLEKDDFVEKAGFKKLAGVDLFQRLERNAYRGEYLGYTGLQKEHFKLFAGLANGTQAFLLKRPSKLESISDIQKIMIELIQN